MKRKLILVFFILPLFSISFHGQANITLSPDISYPPNGELTGAVTGSLRGHSPYLGKIRAQGTLAPNYSLVVKFNDNEFYQFLDDDRDVGDISPDTLMWYCFKNSKTLTEALESPNPPTMSDIISANEAKPLGAGVYTHDENRLLITPEIYLDSSCDSIGFTLQPKTNTGFPHENKVLIMPDYQLIASLSKDGIPEYQAIEMIPLADASDIPFQSNAYLTFPKLVDGKMTSAGMTNWTNPNYVYSLYVYAKQSGSYPVYLNYQISKDATIKVSYQNEDFFVVLEADKTVAYVGEMITEGETYLQMNFQGIAKKGGDFGSISAVLVPKSLAPNLIYDPNYQRTLKVNGLSMTYTKPSNELYEWFYAEATMAENGDGPLSYFAILQMPFAYTGIQVLDNTAQKKIIFSVWSPFETDNPKEIPEEYRVQALKIGEGITTNDFGFEGSGFQSYINYPWIAGKKYAFLVRMKPEGENSTLYTTFFKPVEASQWQLMATVRRPLTHASLSSLVSFLEPFGSYLYDYKNRQSQMGNVWVATADQIWQPIIHARTHNPNSAYRQDLQYKVIDNDFVMQQNGFIGPQMMPDNLTITAGSPPSINLNEMISASLPEGYRSPQEKEGVRAVMRSLSHPHFQWSADPAHSFPTTAFNGADFRLFTPQASQFYEWEFEGIENAEFMSWDKSTQILKFIANQQALSQVDFPSSQVRGRITAKLNTLAMAEPWYEEELAKGSFVHEFAIKRWFYIHDIRPSGITITSAQQYCRNIGKDTQPNKRFNLALYSDITDAIPNYITNKDTLAIKAGTLGYLWNEWGGLSDWTQNVVTSGKGWPQSPYDFLWVAYTPDGQVINTVDNVNWGYTVRVSDGLIRPHSSADAFLFSNTPACVVDLVN